MSFRSRLLAIAVTAVFTAGMVGCGGDEIKDPKAPSDAPKLEPKKPAGPPGAPGGGAGGKPGSGAQ